MSTPQKLAQYLAGAEARRATVDGPDIDSPHLAGKDYAVAGRGSPGKGYAAVKSKVAGNMKSIKKTQTRTMMQRAQENGETNAVEGAPRRAKTYTSPKKTKKVANAGDHDQIIREIKNKYSKDAINGMSHEQLAAEILEIQGRKANGTQ